MKRFLIIALILAIQALGVAQADDGIPELPEPTVGGLTIFGRYEQDNTADNGPENILWVVLELDDEKMVLLSREGLAARPYNAEGGDTTWETCSLRKWLNEDFLNEAFSEAEQAMLANVSLPADANPEYPTPAGNDTEDRVYLPSLREVDAWNSNGNLFFCYASYYARANGARFGRNGACNWWLRSPGEDAASAAVVSDYGTAFALGLPTNMSSVLVRPMITVRRSAQPAEAAAQDTEAAAQDTDALSWRGYALKAAWLSTDPADIAIPNPRTDGLFVLVRLVPVEGTVSRETVNEYAADEIVLRTAAGEDQPVAMMTFRTFLPSEGEGFPEIDPEQNDFDVLYFLKGATEADLEGATLVVTDDGAEQVLALDAISREKPTQEGFTEEKPE